MDEKERNKDEQRLHYTLEQWKKIGSSDIINFISEHVTLAQLMGSLVNVNHALCVVGKCIFDSN